MTRCLTAGLCLIALLVFADLASASTPYADVTSAGPLTHVYLGNELSCQVDMHGDAGVYPDTGVPADCGTLVKYDNWLYKPDFTAHSGSSVNGLSATGTVYTPVSQTRTGNVVVTVVDAGAKLRLTQTDTYAPGDEFWTTKVAVENVSGAPLSASVYRAQDCYLGPVDIGTGDQDATTGGIACDDGYGDIQSLVPGQGQGALSFEAMWANLWAAIRNLNDFDGSCAVCGSLLDNGVALQYPLSLAAGETKTIAWRAGFTENGGPRPAPPAAPVRVTPPHVTLGASLTAQPATWTGAATTAYRWQRCSATCTDVASGLAYTPVAGDRLRFAETATNAAGSTEAFVDVAPLNLAAPAITRAGDTLTASAGAWAGADSLVVSWERCAATCVAIADGATYELTADDAGARIRAMAVGTNPGGTASAYSADVAIPSAPVTAAVAPPAPAVCVSSRELTLHWRVKAHVRSFSVIVGGRVVAKLGGSARSTHVSLRGLGAGVVTVLVSGRARDGHAYGTRRSYVTCAKRQAKPAPRLALTRL